jgi:predicted small metal-binding protein
VTVDHQVGEQQSPLAAGQAGIEPLTVALDSQRPADLDPHEVRGRQGHANILALRWAARPERRRQVKLIRCECGFVARGDSDDQVVGMIRGHMATDHPALLESVSREDLASWIQAE